MEEINEMVKCNESEMWKLMFEVAKLKKENLMLKAEKNNKLLHKEIEIEEKENDDTSMLNEYEEEYLVGCENDEDLKAYAEALNNCSVKK